MLKILLIEPHGDDGICSASSVLRSSKDKVSLDIVTLSERSSEGLKSIYDNINNVIFFDLPDLNYSKRPKVSTYDIHRRYLNGENVYSYYFDKVKSSYSEFYNVVDSISEHLQTILRNNSYDIVLGPVGLCHPYHLAVSNGLLSALCVLRDYKVKVPELIHYVDKPYYQHRYVKEMCESFKLFHRVVFNSPIVDKEDSIINTFKEVYPSELSMMRFSKDILTNHVDTYICKDTVLYNTIASFKEVLS